MPPGNRTVAEPRGDRRNAGGPGADPGVGQRSPALRVDFARLLLLRYYYFSVKVTYNMKKTKSFSESEEETPMSSKIDFDEINRIIRLLEDKNLAQFELEIEGFKIKITRTAPAAAPVTPLAAPTAPGRPAGGALSTGAAASGTPAPAGQEPFHFVTSPMVGMFYRAPAPNAPPFVEVGEPVKKKQTLCIIEAMKLMNEIECDLDGVVKEIFVENGKPVEYGQRLFSIGPPA
jgi:acetyl-CoA carboxylase biotin carboxyl carrier protein